MAMLAGACSIDMEFVQFHPTGRVCLPNVKATRVAEGVRREGDVVSNGERKRFMFDNLPKMFQGEFAVIEDEANRWVSAVVARETPDVRPPPELLKRVVVPRAIRKAVREGRGSPPGGVFLDIASHRSAKEIKNKLPSMYH